MRTETRFFAFFAAILFLAAGLVAPLAIAQSKANSANLKSRVQEACQASFETSWSSWQRTKTGSSMSKEQFVANLTRNADGCRNDAQAIATQESFLAHHKKSLNHWTAREHPSVANNIQSSIDGIEAALCVLRWLGSPQCTAGSLATAQAHRLTNEQVMANCSSEMAMSDAALVQSWEKSAQETWRLARELKAKGSRYELKEEAARKLEAQAADLRSAGFRSEHSIAMGNPASFYRDRTVPQLQELMGILKAKAQSGTHIDRGSAPSLICIIQLELSARQSKASAGTASPGTAPPAAPNRAQAEQRQAALDEQRRGKPKRNYSDRMAHQCVSLLKDNSLGGFTNTCTYPIRFTWCVHRPKKGAWSESFDCAGMGSFSNTFLPAGGRTGEHTKNAEKVLWFACRVDNPDNDIIEVGDAEFNPSGPSIRARCVKWGDRS